MTLGICLPGQYTLRYTVTNAAGATNRGFIIITIEAFSSMNLEYTFVPPDRSEAYLPRFVVSLIFCQ